MSESVKGKGSEAKARQLLAFLLELASREDAPAEERELAQRKADALLLKYRIDASTVKGAPSRREVGHEDWDIDWPWEFYEDMTTLMYYITAHCNLRIAYHHRKVTVVGFGEDIQFANMLWTTILLEFVRHMYPTWKKDATFDDNVYRMVKGGYKWAKIHAQHVIADPAGAPAKLSSRYKAAYIRQCDVLGEEPAAHTQRHSAFRASYCQAFVATVGRRLREMRINSEQEVVEDRDKYALAIKDTAEQIEEEFYRLYPQFDPEATARASAAQREAEQRRRDAMTQKERDAEDARLAREAAKARRYYEQTRDRKYDPNGWKRGTQVGSNVDLSGGRGKVTPNRNELEGS
jgi:hypothetical protein